MGEFVGLCVGSLVVGLPDVGLGVGDLVVVGELVGAVVGEFVGAVVGAEVGEVVGPLVGSVVGTSVGALVGLTVRPQAWQ